MYRSHVLVCGGTGCSSSNSQQIIDTLNAELKANGLENEVKVVKTGCFGLCALGPIMIVYPEGSFYSEVKPENIPEIVSEHLLKGRVVKHLLYKETVSEDSDRIKSLDETQFYAKQHRVALRNCGVIDPENIDEYIAVDGYQALGKVLTEMTPQEVIDVMLASGLRGRGGAGFPTGRKWAFAAANKADQKYVCCNADEGDPGAFMDRSILEGDPHVIIEAMAIAAYAIGANHGFVYIRAEYPIAVQRLQHAIDQAREVGLLGKNILGTGFDFDMELRLGAGAFVCGEETALMTSIDGKRGEPRPRPPFPTTAGIFGKPTVLNNVETYANVCWIINHGAEAYAALGTDFINTLQSFDLNFLGINLGETPSFGLNVLMLIPILSGVTAFIPSWLSMKNNPAMLEGPGAGSMKVMLLVSPLMSLYIAFQVPAGVGMYWIFSNVFMMIQTMVLNKFYNPKEMAEKAKQEAEQRREQERLERIEAKKKARAGDAEAKERAKKQKEINRQKLAEARKRDAEKYGDVYTEVTDDDLE